MKKVFGLLAAGAMIVAVANCSSIDTTTVGGKTVVTSTEAAPVIFMTMGAPVTKCLDALNAEGVTTVTNANGGATGGLFSIARISGAESCQATGTK